MSQLLTSRTLERLGVLDLATRRAGGGGGFGERPAGAAGVGTIFHEHRTYSPGDDLRYVDWNAYGRLRTLYVKVFELEENLDVHLLLDATASMGTGRGSKLEAGCRAAAMVGATALARGDVVRLRLLPGREAKAFAQAASAPQLLASLSNVQASARVPLGEAIRSAFPRLRRRGYALLVTDFLDEPASWRRAVDYLAHLRVELTCIHVVSTAERNPVVGGSLRVRDVESGATVDLDVDADLLAKYRNRFEKRLREVRAYLRSKQVRHVIVETGRAAEPELLRQLLREGVLR